MLKKKKKIKNKKRQAGCPDAISDKNISYSRKTLQELIMKRIGFFSSHFASKTTLTYFLLQDKASIIVKFIITSPAAVSRGT